MNIKYRIRERDAETGAVTESSLEEIVIELDPADDPDGHLMGLIARERLEPLLAAYARPLDFGAEGLNAAAYANYLGRLTFVIESLERRREGMELAARDMHLCSWGHLATVEEEAKTTIRSRVARTREEYAARGYWYDPDGLHHGTVDEALAHARRERVLDLGGDED